MRTHRNDTTVRNSFEYENIMIYAIDHVLNIPLSFAETVPYDNSSLFGIQQGLSQITLPVFNSATNMTGNDTAFNVLNADTRGFTLFAPNTTAIAAAESALAPLASNQTALVALIQNHVRPHPFQQSLSAC